MVGTLAKTTATKQLSFGILGTTAGRKPEPDATHIGRIVHTAPAIVALNRAPRCARAYVDCLVYSGQISGTTKTATNSISTFKPTPTRA